MGWAKKNILKIDEGGYYSCLYIKVSTLANGFWGLSEKFLELIEVSSSRWFVILLKRSPYSGYFLSPGFIRQIINNRDWRVSKGGDYKVHEVDLPSKDFSNNLNELTNCLGY